MLCFGSAWLLRFSKGLRIEKPVLFGLQGSTESCNTTTEDEDLKGRCWPWVGKGRQQCPRCLGPSGAPASSAPRAEMGGSEFSRRGRGLKLLSRGHDGRLLSVVAGLGKRPLFSDPTSGIAELELFLSLPRARAQRPVPVAENAGSSQSRDPWSPYRSRPPTPWVVSRVTGCLHTPRTEVTPKMWDFLFQNGDRPRHIGRRGSLSSQSRGTNSGVRTPSGDVLAML